jgi:Gpi18-like mannosyltransferase
MIALLALVATWSQNLSYFLPEDGWFAGFVLATARFWPATLATPASTSITVDLLLLLIPLTALMVIEARRIELRFVWLYVVLGALVAISVTFPLFLIAREMRLAARGEASESLGLDRADSLVLLVLGVAIAIFSVWTLGR